MKKIMFFLVVLVCSLFVSNVNAIPSAKKNPVYVKLDALHLFKFDDKIITFIGEKGYYVKKVHFLHGQYYAKRTHMKKIKITFYEGNIYKRMS